jgi:methyl-accepting chemotaxis protein
MKKLSIKLRLLASNLAAIGFVVLVGAIGYLAAGELDAEMDAIGDDSVLMKDVMAADQADDALRIDMLAALLAGADADDAERTRAQRDGTEHAVRLRTLMATLAKHEARLDVKPEIRSALARVRPDGEAYLQSFERTMALAEPAAARQAHAAFLQRFQALDTSMDALVAHIEHAAQATRAQGDAAVERVRRRIAIVALLAALVALGTGTLLARSVGRELDEAIGFADLIARGRLDARLACADNDDTETGRLKRALASMRDSLRDIVGQVRGGTDSIATAAREIAAGSLDLSVRTEQQAAALEETASSMVKHSADNARQASQVAQSAAEVAQRGGAVVGQVVQTMGAIDGASRRIADITGVIEGIAFQTNILALNAAVEAARAGEQGRGFAVVAGEVRTLAQRANAAAREIKGLIDDSVQQVGAGSRLVQEAGSTMRDVVDGVRRVSDIVGDISAASREQDTGIEQINQAVVEIDAVTQQNAALVEEASAASAAMQMQAEQLRKLVSVFVLEDGDGQREPVAAAGRGRLALQ